ncbi:helix-turn-helix domain-containing protein [Clostridium botulinum]|uniref:helix-turn-helix domain-containing protein n=1 Tax=Clostridium botulinum TaxID=1491 RepID=UPI0004D73A18|nr:helix-turn-helix transcriptional regulator [Clostridium botulinum]KEH90517.1 transcriptional regulator [Clostridium botulinum C/D str. It1]
MDLKKIIALNIYTLRNKHNLTQEEFANKLNTCGDITITRGHISRIENGNHIPSAEFIKAVATVFQVNVNWLLATDPDLKTDEFLSNGEIELIAKYRKLPIDLKAIIKNLINSILELS